MSEEIPKKNPAAVTLGRLGGSTKASKPKGLAALSPEQRAEIQQRSLETRRAKRAAHIKIGDYVSAGTGADYDTGKVESIVSKRNAYVAWKSGIKTIYPIKDLTKETNAMHEKEEA